jgi:hypothetical protein
MSHCKLPGRTILPAFFAALLLCGCSTFNYEWRQAVKKSTPTNDITGRWEGRWISQVNGHNDQLRCLITRVDETHYDAKFHAAYKTWITFHFGYTARLEAKPGTNGVTFDGTADLGLLAGGVYTYEGRADPTNFFSTYDSKYDRGVFQMQRPSRDP